MLSFTHYRNGKPSPPVRVTHGALGRNYGPDSGRPLVVSLEPGDLVVFRPKGTRQRLAVSVFDLYAYAVRCAALARARDRQAARTGRRPAAE